MLDLASLSPSQLVLANSSSYNAGGLWGGSALSESRAKEFVTTRFWVLLEGSRFSRLGMNWRMKAFSVGRQQHMMAMSSSNVLQATIRLFFSIRIEMGGIEMSRIRMRNIPDQIDLPLGEQNVTRAAEKPSQQVR